MKRYASMESIRRLIEAIIAAAVCVTNLGNIIHTAFPSLRNQTLGKCGKRVWAIDWSGSVPSTRYAGALPIGFRKLKGIANHHISAFILDPMHNPFPVSLTIYSYTPQIIYTTNVMQYNLASHIAKLR